MNDFAGSLGLAQVLDTLGANRQARCHRRDALLLYTSLGVPEADDIRARLAASSPASND